MEFEHVTVLLREAVEGLAIRADGLYLDGTAGGAGHSKAIASRLTTGRLIALDKDPEAVRVASGRLQGLPAEVIRADFRDIPSVLKGLGIGGVDGILLDLGVSSYQLDNPERGFSYAADAPLDMRMSGEGMSARDLCGTASAEELERILREYGEERFARRIAQNIVRARDEAPIETTGQLAELVRASIPAAARRTGGNPCKRTFQALRIAVNGELEALEEAVDKAFQCLNPGGRFAVITFHSLEDRICKQRFAALSKGCVCPPDCPVCICGRTPQARTLTRRPILPSEEEQMANRRSHSAKLRIIEKL
ncbi:MAG: 16S rRNA (cytosine(1402)-N(4))-methyltransferase RsmH [Provencibacterium sp.]|nr:16S rRNA (cytosine(1402)-N(4))-methyltransferase RsmH [Provencibacterium sp.]